MGSYRFARRSFLAAAGGALGLRVLLDNLEAAAAGATSPPRFLLTHWPLGTVKYLFKPTGVGPDYAPSPIIQPFIDAGLKDDMSVLYGLQIDFNFSRIGGGHEAGTVYMSTGIDSPGTRKNDGEIDDSVAGGPSFDQIFLRNVPRLQGPAGATFINAICEARVDSRETSTRCLSYSYAQRSVEAAVGGSGGAVLEATPLLPELNPLQLYLSTFAQLMPGGATRANQAELLRGVKMRRSVLDYGLRELGALKRLAPGSERSKLETHESAIRDAERILEAQIESGVIDVFDCTTPAPPSATLVGQTGDVNWNYAPYPVPVAESEDELHEQVGKAHMALITAAFQCDLARVATFQWAPGQSHVAFKGQYPGQPDKSYRHHPLSHLITGSRALGSAPPSDEQAVLLQFLGNVQTWYSAKTAALLSAFKATKDAFGNSLLDHTVVPYLTEIAQAGHTRKPIPAFIFGGKALGMTHGRFYDFEAAPRSHNDIWATIAQAYLGVNPLAQLDRESFFKDGVTAIEGIWRAPT